MDWLIHLGIYILQGMFLVGVIGSTIVLVLSAISESRSAFGSGDDGKD